MDRYIFINNDYITIYNELQKNINRYDFNLNKMIVKKGTIETSKRLKELFTKSEKINFYKKIKTKNYINYIFIKKDKIINCDYLCFNDIYDAYIININQFINNFSISQVKKISENEFIHNITYLSNIKELKYYSHNVYLKNKRNYIIFN